MKPLQITAKLASPMAVPLYPVALDALLAAMVCERLGLVSGVDSQHGEAPVARSSCGRYHLASVGHYEPTSFFGGHINKRTPVAEFMMLGDSRIRSVNTGTGRNKAYRVPQPRMLIGPMRWWCIGYADEIESLLRQVTHIGKKRSAGYGRVGGWTVEPVEPWHGFPILRPDGTPMRNLPKDTPGIGPSAASGWGGITYPYWCEQGWQDVAQPPNTQWMGVA